jgi:hypothetical protein
MTSVLNHKPPLLVDDASQSSSAAEEAALARFLYRPIVFQEPNRTVHPPSWLEHIPFAFWIIDVLRPRVLVELGTHSGNSYSAFAQAIQTLALPTAAYAVDTWEGDEHAGFYGANVFAEWSAYHNRHFGGFSRLMRSTFDEACEYFSDGSIDLLHIDGCHTYDAVAGDFKRWLPKVSDRGVILLHDVNVRERDFGTWRLWEELKAHAPAFEFLHGHGLGVVSTSADLPEPLHWMLSRTTQSAEEVGGIRQYFSRLGGAVSASYTARAIVENKPAGVRADPQAGNDGPDMLGAEPGSRDELIQERGRLVSTLALIEAQAKEKAHADLQAAHDEAIRQKTRLLAELHERLRSESARNKQLEAEQKRLTAVVAERSVPAVDRLTSALTCWSRTGQGRRYRVRARHARAVSKLLGRSVLPLAANPGTIREAYTLVASGLFDEAYYVLRYPDVAGARMTPLAHFLTSGAREGRSPHPLFDAAYYLRTNPDVVANRTNPVIHYLAHGRFENRNPHPLFDVAFYRDANPDVRAAGTDPLLHFLTSGAAEGRDPSPFFSCSYYTREYPDVKEHGANPLRHFVIDGWRENRRPSESFDPAYYREQNPDLQFLNVNPLLHYLEHGRSEGRRPFAEPAAGGATLQEMAPADIKLRVESLAPGRANPKTVICVSHVMPWHPRAGNEYRIYRMLRWLQAQGYLIVPVIAPLPGEEIDAEAVRGLAGEFSNAVLCHRDGRLQYVLRDLPDVLASLDGQFTRPVSILLDEDGERDEHARQLTTMDRVFCHDALITTVLRLQNAIGPSILLAEYIWMSRIMPLVSADVLKIIDTIDVFSTKREKVLRFGIDDLHVDAREEARRLQHADLVLAIHDEERRMLQQLVPSKPVVSAGVDVDVVQDGGRASGREVLYVASDNPMNTKGLADFLRFAWPTIRRDVPDATLVVAGKVSATLEGDVPGVSSVGVVDDLAPLYERARVVINPAVAGTGLKIKTLEALGHLRPIVTWPGGADGLAPELASFCAIVQDWHDFARQVTRALAETPSGHSKAERDAIAALLSPAAAYREMTDAIAALREERMGSARASG